MPIPSDMIAPVLDPFTTSSGWVAFLIGVIGRRALERLKSIWDGFREE